MPTVFAASGSGGVYDVTLNSNDFEATDNNSQATGGVYAVNMVLGDKAPDTQTTEGTFLTSIGVYFEQVFNGCSQVLLENADVGNQITGFFYFGVMVALVGILIVAVLKVRGAFG